MFFKYMLNVILLRLIMKFHICSYFSRIIIHVNLILTPLGLYKYNQEEKYLIFVDKIKWSNLVCCIATFLKQCFLKQHFLNNVFLKQHLKNNVELIILPSYYSIHHLSLTHSVHRFIM